ncbi:MAG TPA: GNAT family N-acetyltransferase, partial [Thermomicrobiales bacterium]|nr:GNAT family N-acetyltransferase [Thermomicrobiales bacterium]
MALADHGLILVPATAADHDWLFTLHREAMGPYVEAIWGWDDSVQRPFFERFLAAGNVWVIKRGKMPVGVVQWQDQGDHLFLSQIEVAPAHQGKGIGAAVIR